ncbi:glycosyltransferase [Nocardioides zhouii]|uniref:Glycosyltransferase n=1 Tax=Nocardioides zhouii TaxID=1168729 RepID=A0A4Q2T5M2_9ACTN|nr:glycosyltransferase [Nocardioides zhouii]RYC13391.1 glycosyltransferase [Nocardioides zhouii]
MIEVDVRAVPLEQLGAMLAPDRAAALEASAARARAVLSDRTIWHVNATAHGGGVAEMLQTLLAYGNGAGVDNRWLVLDADAAFFTITKRVHNMLHGAPGDGGRLGDAERAHYSAVLETNLRQILPQLAPRDIVLLHDPQTAGLASGLRRAGVHVAWRCHVGRDDSNEMTDLAWDFLRPMIEPAEVLVFSRLAYAPEWTDPARVAVIAPSVDPFSAKNLTPSADAVDNLLATVGLVTGIVPSGRVTFDRRDGTQGTVRLRAATGGLVLDGPAPPHDARLVVQVSRWDRLKDMSGVMTGFATMLRRHGPGDTHLMLVGPAVAGVSDDPEGAEVLDECRRQWHALPAYVQSRVHLASVPMDDPDENAIVINALQRHAHVIVQKSLVEGFGLTATEAMWKSKPVVASMVGGIRDQITDGVDGLQVPDPCDLDAFAAVLHHLLSDDDLAARLGQAAHERVRSEYLPDRHLAQYVDLFVRLVTCDEHPTC